MGKSSGAGSPLATGAMFFGAGFGIASTFSRMPGIRDQLGVSPDQLAFALVFLGIGSLLFEFGAMLLIVGAGVGDAGMNVQGHLVEERRVL